MSYVEKKFNEAVFIRSDEKPHVFLFSCKDFYGLQTEALDFVSSKGHKMRAFFYYYPNFIKDRLIIFDHGMYSGHRSYLREIELLCKNGYLVLAEDHTGCFESEGESTGGFAQSLCDLDDLIKVVKNDSRLSSMDISVIGHSWGGFSAMNIVKFHPEISHVVALSGFISVEAIISQHVPFIFSREVKKLVANEMRLNPSYAGVSGVETLKNTDSRVLIVHSTDDKVVKYKKHAYVLEKELAGKENIEFLIVNGKGHHPNYTKEAIARKDQFFKDAKVAFKKKQLTSTEECEEFKARYDWRAITRQDKAVWKVILDFLK